MHARVREISFPSRRNGVSERRRSRAQKDSLSRSPFQRFHCVLQRVPCARAVRAGELSSCSRCRGFKRIPMSTDYSKKKKKKVKRRDACAACMPVHAYLRYHTLERSRGAARRRKRGRHDVLRYPEISRIITRSDTLIVRVPYEYSYRTSTRGLRSGYGGTFCFIG